MSKENHALNQVRNYDDGLTKLRWNCILFMLAVRMHRNYLNFKAQNADEDAVHGADLSTDFLCHDLRVTVWNAI